MSSFLYYQACDYRNNDGSYQPQTDYDEYITDIIWPRSPLLPFSIQSQWYDWPDDQSSYGGAICGALPRIFYIDLVNGNDNNHNNTQAIVSTTNTAPIVVNVTEHSLTTGMRVFISGHTTNTNANGLWSINVLDENYFYLSESTGNGVGAATGNIYPKPLESSTNTNPIVVTQYNHGFSTGTRVNITGHTVNTNANGTFTITSASVNTFSLNGTSGNGVGGSTGFIYPHPIESSTSAFPISVSAINHGLVTGEVVTIAGVVTNTAANGTWSVTVVDSNNYTIPIKGNGNGGATGYVVSQGGSGWADAWKTVTYGATAATNTFQLLGSKCNGSGGATGIIQLMEHRVVTLASSRTLDIDQCLDTTTNGTAFVLTGHNSATVGANVLNRVCGALSTNTLITLPGSPAASTLYAHKQISSVGIDYSAYQNISFWVRVSVAIPDNRDLTLCLCSDTAGVTVVDTFKIPALIGLNRWTCLTLPRVGGGNLGSSIKSWAIISGTVAPTASTTLRICNIVASKTGDLDLTSLISQNALEQGGFEGWYAIQSISKDGTVLNLDWDTESLPQVPRGYYGNAGSFTTYQRHSFMTYMVAAAATSVQAATKTGSQGLPISYYGGWNTTTGLQSGETFYDGANGNGYGFYNGAFNYINSNFLSFSRYYYGVILYGLGYYGNHNITNMTCNASNGLYATNSFTLNVVNILNANNNADRGVYISAYSVTSNIINIGNCNNNFNTGLMMYSTCLKNVVTIINACNTRG